MWVFIKDKVYRPPMPPNLAQFRHRISATVQEMTPDMFQRVWQENLLSVRCELYMTNGAHIEP
ncbi:hypothetical protein C0J52_17503 [Blattella germanica]|nr:hypothetical protein C0J52_17503 [Blattella germanica]